MIETLLQATTRILRREGRESLTTNRIAEVAGVSVGSLYQYFPNKESLLDELRERFETQFLERMIRAFGSGASLPLREAVREFARFIIDIHREDPQLHNELSPEIPVGQHRTVCEMVRVYLEAHRDEVRRPDLEIATYVVVEVGESLVHNTALRAPERLEDPRFLDEVCDLMERYLAK
jgi:AcrR family transcriptional regulator